MAVRRRMPLIIAFIACCLLGYTVLWVRTSNPPYEELEQYISSPKPMHPVEEPVSVDEQYLAFFTHSGFQNQLIQGNIVDDPPHQNILFCLPFTLPYLTFPTCSGKRNIISLVFESDIAFAKSFIRSTFRMVFVR